MTGRRPSTRIGSLGAGRERARWMLVVTFAAGMAWVEAACVYYLRVMVDRVEPYQPDPLPIRGSLGEVELVREGATLLMLAMTGMLAGRTWRARLGYAAIAFGSWDILYYVFLRIISGWPASLIDWDILFLLPLPWWGPVLAPVCIASLMIVWGTLVTQWQDRIAATRFTRASWGVSCAGILLALGYSWPIRFVPCPEGSTRFVRCCRGPSTGPCSARRSCSWPRRWRTPAGDRCRAAGSSPEDRGEASALSPYRRWSWQKLRSQVTEARVAQASRIVISAMSSAPAGITPGTPRSR
jgi:hypothetical protein